MSQNLYNIIEIRPLKNDLYSVVHKEAVREGLKIKRSISVLFSRYDLATAQELAAFAVKDLGAVFNPDGDGR